MKIHILGGSGSGKTTLAGQIATRFSIPHYDLDMLGMKPGVVSYADYVKEALSILEQSAWVTEGIYLFWTDPLLHEADYIVLLDIPYALAVWRVLQRHVVKTLNGTNPYATKLLWPLFKGMHHMYATSDDLMSDFVCQYLAAYREVTEPPTTGFTPEYRQTYLHIQQEISAPLTDEFKERYQELYGAGGEPSLMEYLHRFHDEFLATVEPRQNLLFVKRYLECYQEKVVVIKNNADRDRFLEGLTQKFASQ